MPKFAQITTRPAMITPPAIIGKAYQKRISNKKAATEPVQTPVMGSGIATKNSKKNAPYFSYLTSCFRVLLNSQQKKISSICHLLKKSENGLRYINRNIAGTRFPKTANI